MDNNPRRQPTPRKPSEGPKQPELSLQATSLFRLDINYDYLKTFLEQIQGTLTKDREDIDMLKRLTGTKALNHTLTDDYMGFSESLTLHDKELLNEIQEYIHTYSTNLAAKSKGVVQGPYEKAVIDVRSKMFSQSHVLQQIFTLSKKQELRIQKLEKEMLLKMETKDCKQKFRKLKSNMEKQGEDLQKQIRTELQESEQRTQQDIIKFEEIVRDVERKTLWKIQDCHDLLSKRINEEFVQDAILSLETKLMKEMNLMSGYDQIHKFQQDIQFMRNLTQGIQDSVTEKQSKMKNSIIELNEQLKAQNLQIERLMESGKTQSDRLSDFSGKLVNAMNRLDFSYQVDQQANKIRHLEDTIDRMNEEQQRRLDSLKDMNLNSENISYLLSRIDPHKLCSLESDIKKLEEMTIRNQVHWETLDTEFKNKFDTYNFFTQLQKAQSQQDQPKEKPLNKEEILKILNERIGSMTIEEDKLKKMQKDIQEIGYKMENAMEIERRVTRIFKDMDINGLVKQVKTKANDEEVKKEFLIVETRLGQTMETVANMRRELESLNGHLKKSSSFHANSAISPPTDNPVGLNTKKLYPISCLSCTVQQGGGNAASRIRGNDGKMYKADLNRTVDHVSSQDTDDHQQQQQQYRTQGGNVTVGHLMNKFQARQRPISAKK